jgi:glycosyltransferase involved in cell wall biosynthesis/peptidoglycan/xylan/chitin deacetylase (PgdA/CDA1 family)
MAPPRISVIIPTYQRRDVVLKTVRSLAHQEFGCKFEVIVVVDGSRDGSGEALRGIDVPFPLVVLEQSNRGASIARNQGAAIARGELLLFLDDDMEAHPQLLAEHDRSHREGADAVIGHLPLHPESPSNFLSHAVGVWAEKRVNELSSPNGNLPYREILTGQLSIARETFFKVGGFDTQFTRGGSFGNEDLDFSYRLLERGHKVVFNAQAISGQRYVVTPRQYLRQYRQCGGADVLFARIHPDQVDNIFSDPRCTESLLDRLIWRWWRWLIRLFILALLDRGVQAGSLVKLFFWLVRLEYCQGVREAGGRPQPGPLRILCYHSINDLANSPVIQNYGVPPEQFRQQLDMLKRSGFRFIHGDEFLRCLQGTAGLPRRSILLTFDDCYEELLDVVLPILEEQGIPAVAFAVSGRLGGTNDWDEPIGARQLRLVDANGLRKLAERGVEIGAHSRAHRVLTRLPVDELMAEVSGSVTDLEARGLKRPRLFAYPHGEHNQKVRQAVHESGLQAAFTVDSGLIRPGQDPYQLPRIEILRGDVGRKFKKKVILAGRRGFWLETFWFLLPRLR